MIEARDESKLGERFGRLITRLREADPRGLTVRGAAKLMGISHTRLRSLEQGTHHETGLPTLPTVELVGRIASVYRYPKQELLIQAGFLPWLLDEAEGKQLIGFVADGFPRG